MIKKGKLLKIIALYIVCFGYICLSGSLNRNLGQEVHVMKNVLQLIFYMSIIVLNYLMARERRNKLFDIALLLIPAIIFCASPFIVTLPNLYIYDNTLGDVLRNLMQYSGTYSFVGASILCGLLFRYRERIKSDNN